MAKMETWTLRGRLSTLGEVPSESLDIVNAALQTIPTTTITETNELKYSTAATILEMLGYKMKNPHGEEVRGQSQGGTEES